MATYLDIKKTEYQVLKDERNKPFAIVYILQKNNLLSVAVAIKHPNKDKRFDFRYGKAQAVKRAKHSLYFTEKNAAYHSPLAHTFDLEKEEDTSVLLNSQILVNSIEIVYEDDMPMLTFNF